MKKSESNKLFNEELNKAKEIYNGIKSGLDKRTISSLRVRVNTVDHLSSVRKLVKDLTILKRASQIVMKASKPISTKSAKETTQPKPLQEFFVTGVVSTETLYTWN